MPERRHPTVKIGRRRSDIPVVVLEQFKTEMKDHVAETIETVVNGGIRGIKKQLDDYIVEDTKWKESMEPLREAFTSSKWAFKALVAILKFCGLLVPTYGFYLLIKNIWR